MFQKHKLPIYKYGHWATKSGFFIINLTNQILWITRLLSPYAWIMPFFQVKKDDGFYTSATAAELYQLVVFALCVALLFLPLRELGQASVLMSFSGVLIVEAIGYQFRVIVLRPAIEQNYKHYSASRTVLILIIQYLKVIVLFAVIYAAYFHASFNVALTKSMAIEFSTISMTTVGYGSIVAQPGSYAAILAAAQGVIGIFFIGMMMSSALARIRPVEEVGDGQ